LSANDPPNHLHGGFRGFNRQIWQTLSMDSSRALFRRVSPAGEEGYPGYTDGDRRPMRCQTTSCESSTKLRPMRRRT
jgi:hypothetical protein